MENTLHEKVSQDILLKAYNHMMLAKAMADIYEENRNVCKYVHSTSRGHEAIQLATAYQLTKEDWVSPYYRDESILLGIGFEPYQLMLQLLAKSDDPFSGGRSYYSHPSSRAEDKPKMIHQSSATGMQTIPTTGVAQGIKYIQEFELQNYDHNPVVVCSLGDNSVTEGEVSEALQFAALHQLPIIFLVQDNEWGISVTKEEARTCDAYDFVAGFVGLNRMRVDGTDFIESFEVMKKAFDFVRTERKPLVVCAKTVLIGHHTSGVRREFYRDEDDLTKHRAKDPGEILKKQLLEAGIEEEQLNHIIQKTRQKAEEDFEKAKNAEDPKPETVMQHVFAPTPVTEETGTREPEGGEKIVMVDAAIHAIQELMWKHPEALLYGQDVGERIGGVFRETVTLGKKFGKSRVFNTPIQEAYIIGSTAGMSAVGLKPIVEVQFADYIYPGINQLITEISKSNYLSNGKFPVSNIIRVPIGAYGGGGPYHSGSVESILANIKGIKIAYPSNAADFKGLLKAAYYDPNPVIMLEHKGLYWSKVPGTEDAKTIEPAEDYILPFGKGKVVVNADQEETDKGRTVLVVTYGMGVYWAKEAAKNFAGRVEVIDLRTLLPLDETLVFERVKEHGKCIVLTEEQLNNSFAEAFAHRIAKNCFRHLDAPVETMGALDLPAVPINLILEKEMLPNAEKLSRKIEEMLRY
ncbi:2-oxoisovalerate dehydrogenase E1 component [Chryseobacterium sp. SORGH_AS909]|uniref:alpha-ketoacid dehydrogenase subunit alpha/beta n=1 Tax=unclassified Chryseobacterium TaxID=2593645 RepID=UPI00277D4628|nr:MULTISPECIES: alpha-ketoacid dehydrogenase subunit alpha/beta [unclassified Chryseobacterium]MDQ1099412.1 2-oxoisovalerate dehydrogenase E1 component [Chryseobacterium sp. SORGH_AS_1048]MDR6086758.1 2-oxoisovalerate dehydrogenase E1 component [Chryseobacterium sp. SORGH_AS_0909]MDR6131131.1 2-oxoisovalerate dehydrogenase E1 component [Chryseobacterium sp. SORGH_AS_1175]MDT3406729.1 2-oxoisovalerate dehydrogenase E1 component [Pseudacidovorax intermedius]